MIRVQLREAERNKTEHNRRIFPRHHDAAGEGGCHNYCLVDALRFGANRRESLAPDSKCDLRRFARRRTRLRRIAQLHDPRIDIVDAIPAPSRTSMQGMQNQRDTKSDTGFIQFEEQMAD